MNLRRLNPQGIRAFQSFLDSFTAGAPLPWPESILGDPQYSESVSKSVTVETRSFDTRFELAEHLHTRFEAAQFQPERSDAGLWAWIACFFFNEICPTSRGIQQPGSAPRWIPQSSDWRRYYRHLVAGPYGAGRSVAWTSDLSPHWLPQSFVDWPGYKALWRGILGWVTHQI